MSYTQKQVTDALRLVKFPGSDKDIMALDMVRNIKIEGKKIGFDLVFQKSDDPNIITLKKLCVSAILKFVDKEAEIKGNIKVKAVHIVDEPGVLPNVKNIIAIASGKGGVGKSTVASNLAVALANAGAKVGLIDADIFGPSVPKMFGSEAARPSLIKIDDKDRIEPHEKFGVKMLSIGFFVDPAQATVWRGPMASNALKQMIEEGNWGELDFVLIDLPPGTSDIHLTLVQTVPVTGAVIVSTPQEVALADAVKAISMFEGAGVNVPVLGMVENMAWFTPAELPENKYYIFGKDGCKNLAEEKGIDLLGQIPIVQSIREGGDNGIPAAVNTDTVTGMAFADLAAKLMSVVDQRNADKDPTKRVEITR
ncbi:Mrp/NBP35 family ATP-binding protein [Labilibaculum euxinus]|uniref:Iron-sulfur cluster carrier protein n=1 Tax=Labilibaculum euxinus TaxID=2686357 RepID=A0A7M4D3X1_9BACT|nr:Mrp/NBP35 family ATP-binding protein [Labilibaculum euxinus]MUP37350.1 P-loop NTPase [Labilibaculum euxinus]MVB06555.1 P-loop NTPase [Labilibaculum euxinus]